MGYAPREVAYNIEYQFERRRYNNRTFTWLHWRKRDQALDNPWRTYGDPYPTVRISKADLTKALDDIRFSLLSTGSRIRIGTGAEATVVSLDFLKREAEVLVDTCPGRTYVTPANHIVEIIA